MLLISPRTSQTPQLHVVPFSALCHHSPQTKSGTLSQPGLLPFLTLPFPPNIPARGQAQWSFHFKYLPISSYPMVNANFHKSSQTSVKLPTALSSPTVFSPLAAPPKAPPSSFYNMNVFILFSSLKSFIDFNGHRI
jgi:hypothetical protein